MTPQELGIFVHKVFEAFFSEWNRLGKRGITPENLSEARAVFRDVVEPLLAISPTMRRRCSVRGCWGPQPMKAWRRRSFRSRLNGRRRSNGGCWSTPSAANSRFRQTSETRRVNLRGKADRIDLLADGTFRIIDYKLTRAPDRKLALQLPIYTICTAQHLLATTGKAWEPGQAGYIAFGGDRRFVPMLGRGKDKEATLRAAQTRLLDTIDAIERGEFPPRPAETHKCLRCAHATVCRKDYVGDV